MFAVTSVYSQITPGLNLMTYGWVAWEDFFYHVSVGRTTVAAYYNPSTLDRLKVEYNSKEKRFIHS